MTIGITTLTLFFIVALGTIIYVRIHTLNNAQFYEKLNQSLNLMDVTMRNYFESIATSVNLFSETDLIKEDNDNIKSYVGMADAVKANGKVHFSKAYTTSAGETVIVASRVVKTESGKLHGI